MKNDEFLIKSIGNVKTSLSEKVTYNLYLSKQQDSCADDSVGKMTDLALEFLESATEFFDNGLQSRDFYCRFKIFNCLQLLAGFNLLLCNFFSVNGLSILELIHQPSIASIKLCLDRVIDVGYAVVLRTSLEALSSGAILNKPRTFNFLAGFPLASLSCLSKYLPSYLFKFVGLKQDVLNIDFSFV